MEQCTAMQLPSLFSTVTIIPLLSKSIKVTLSESEEMEAIVFFAVLSALNLTGPADPFSNHFLDWIILFWVILVNPRFISDDGSVERLKLICSNLC
ncbi:hypothetical protein M513_04053 [Trichuris suis]|uniref:Uncharacterized protein n=1 Tax=Trichuris suis TaxID=68888 RepID=A0A085MD39_9BILA|nr:hypothetical protein M513_04053 [Trichuris suis]